jgi:hypothetical protein
MIRSLLRFLKRQKPEPPSTPSVSQTDTPRQPELSLPNTSKRTYEVDLTDMFYPRVIGLSIGLDLSMSLLKELHAIFSAPGWAVNDFRKELS